MPNSENHGSASRHASTADERERVAHRTGDRAPARIRIRPARTSICAGRWRGCRPVRCRDRDPPPLATVPLDRHTQRRRETRGSRPHTGRRFAERIDRAGIDRSRGRGHARRNESRCRSSAICCSSARKSIRQSAVTARDGDARDRCRAVRWLSGCSCGLRRCVHRQSTDASPPRPRARTPPPVLDVAHDGKADQIRDRSAARRRGRRSSRETDDLRESNPEPRVRRRSPHDRRPPRSGSIRPPEDPQARRWAPQEGSPTEEPRAAVPHGKTKDRSSQRSRERRRASDGACGTGSCISSCRTSSGTGDRQGCGTAIQIVRQQVDSAIPQSTKFIRRNVNHDYTSKFRRAFTLRWRCTNSSQRTAGRP